MQTIRLGRTGLTVSRQGFGAIPIQRVSFDEAAFLLRRAYDAGITYYDTARSYSDSEEKIGNALSDVRHNIVLATKTQATTPAGILEHCEISLRNLKTEYIDVYQLHNPANVTDEMYEALVNLKKQGKIRFISITQHSREKAAEAVKSGKYDTLQFPLTFISPDEDLALIDLCREHDIGLLAMKGLAGGLISDGACAFAFLRQFENVVPLWGVERREDLEEFLRYEDAPPVVDDAMRAKWEAYKIELAGNFCRACGYCLPCPAEIEIPTAARIVPLLNRTAVKNFISDEFAAKMERINNCIDCGHCRANCPYGLDTPALLRSQYEGYQESRARYLAANRETAGK